MEQSDIFEFEKNGRYQLNIGTESIDLNSDWKMSKYLSEDIPGWLVANEGRLTVALDINVTKELKEEGIARELINRIQNLRKESNFDVTDKIIVSYRPAQRDKRSCRKFLAIHCQSGISRAHRTNGREG